MSLVIAKAAHTPGELVADIEAKALPDDHVPGGAEPLVQGLLDHLGGLNKQTQGRVEHTLDIVYTRSYPPGITKLSPHFSKLFLK